MTAYYMQLWQTLFEIHTKRKFETTLFNQIQSCLRNSNLLIKSFYHVTDFHAVLADSPCLI